MGAGRYWFLVLAVLALITPPAAPAGEHRSALLTVADGKLSTQLYRRQPAIGRLLSALDPMTLSDMPVSAGIRLGGNLPPGPYAWLLPSPDGSKLATVSYRGNASSHTRARDITMRLFDTATGDQMARVQPAVPILAERLSPNGTQLYGPGLAPVGRGTSRHAVWYAVSTSTGRVVHRVDFPDLDTAAVGYDTLDQRLYALQVHPFDSDTHQPQTPALFAYDVRSGHRVGLLQLPGVLAGSGFTGRQVNGHDVYDQWMPGVALSPSGRELALLDGSTDILRLIDAQTLTVTRRQEVTSPQTLVDRVVDWLGISPRVALAKGGEGKNLQLAFSPDGWHLYVTGVQGKFDTAGNFSYGPIGLQVVDIDRAQIVARAQQSTLLGFSTDGSMLYTLTGLLNGSGFVLRCDDAATLRVLAERTFASHPDLVFLPHPTS